jgi:hypothetical protein
VPRSGQSPCTPGADLTFLPHLHSIVRGGVVSVNMCNRGHAARQRILCFKGTVAPQADRADAGAAATLPRGTQAERAVSGDRDAQVTSRPDVTIAELRA